MQGHSWFTNVDKQMTYWGNKSEMIRRGISDNLAFLNRQFSSWGLPRVIPAGVR